MPVLKNARHERFATEISNGETLTKAYTKAGYKEHRGNASMLYQNEVVQNRVSEILAERTGVVTKKYAVEVEYTREKLIGYLEEARGIAIDKENSNGVTAATLGMARILGLIIDRREVGEVGAFDHLTDEELVREAVRKARELGIAGPHLVEDGSKSSHDGR